MAISHEPTIDSLLKQHSFEEMETVRDNLALEIDKRTQLLKTIVKQKYRDIVDTSDTIRSMRASQQLVERSFNELDQRIGQFYARQQAIPNEDTEPAADQGHTLATKPERCRDDELVLDLLRIYSDMWQNFELDQLQDSLQLLDKARHLLASRLAEPGEVPTELRRLNNAAEESLVLFKRHLSHRIQTSSADRIGIIAPGPGQARLYAFSLECALDWLAERLMQRACDSSYRAQFARHHQMVYYDSRTQQRIIHEESAAAADPHIVRVPNAISPELGDFLHAVCKVVNTIAGFSLNRQSQLESLGRALDCVLGVYERLAGKLESNKEAIDDIAIISPGLKRKRAMQLYFDLLYVRLMLNSAKSVELIERLDPRVAKLASSFEQEIEPVELHFVLPCLHASVLQLSKSTVRLYGLLIPHLH